MPVFLKVLRVMDNYLLEDTAFTKDLSIFREKVEMLVFTAEVLPREQLQFTDLAPPHYTKGSSLSEVFSKVFSIIVLPAILSNKASPLFKVRGTWGSVGE